MLLQPVGNHDPKERFHAPSGVGKAMVRAGIAEEYIDYTQVIANTADRVRWTVDREISGRPTIHAICSRCCHNGQQGNQVFLDSYGKAHEKQFDCFHWHEKAPADVVRLYLAEWKKWARHTQTAAEPFYPKR